MSTCKGMCRQDDLTKVVTTLGANGGISGHLNRRYEQTHEYCKNAGNYQYFNQGNRSSLKHRVSFDTVGPGGKSRTYKGLTTTSTTLEIAPPLEKFTVTVTDHPPACATCGESVNVPPAGTVVNVPVKT